MSAEAFATSTARVDADAHVGGVKRGRIVDAVAHKAHGVPAKIAAP